jgi:concanavalin A-like lectin/glucanase superfamily protein
MTTSRHNDSTIAYGPTALTAGTWTHLATTYDGRVLRFYVNGIQVSSQPSTGDIVTNSYPVQIGGDPIWGAFFAGIVDEVRIYNRALSQAEILTDMSTPVGGAPDEA